MSLQETVLEVLGHFNRVEKSAARASDILYRGLKGKTSSQVLQALKSLETKGLVKRVVNEKTFITWHIV